MARIELKDISKIYPFMEVKSFFNKEKKQEILERQKQMPYTSNEGVIALQHIDLRVEDGEFLVILGESGSGKTTLLRIIAGLERQTLGDVYFDQDNVNELMPEDRDVAMVFQNHSLYPHLNVRDNISYPLRMDHVPQDEIDEIVEEMATLTGIDDILSSMPDRISGGQAQRVAICRALVRKPKVFLLDEPLSNLDNVTRSSLRKLLKKIHDRLKTSFVYVTHDQNDALYLADRVVVLKDGIIEQDSSLSDLYNYPNNIYCASFLGIPKMNIIENIDIIGKRFSLFGRDYLLDKTRKGKCSIGIRPMNVYRSRKGIRAKIDYSEQLEADILMHVTCQGNELCLLEKANDDLSNLLPKGMEIEIDIDERYMHIFDEEGNRTEDSIKRK